MSFLCLLLILTFQIGAIFLWSYVYNIVRISSIRSIEEVNGSTPIAGSPPETYKLLEDGCSEAIASAKDCSTLGQPAVSSAGSEEVVPKEKVSFLFSVCYSIAHFQCYIDFKLVI